MNRALLEKPFPQDAVKTRKGPFGQDLSYVEAAMYIRRLNEAFESRWSWRIIEHKELGSEVMVHGALEVDGVVKHAFGGSSITTQRGTGETVSVADDLKAASTDALKKACSMLGIGLDLHSMSAENQQPNGSPRLQAVPPESTATERNRLTAKQLRAIYAIAHAQGLSESDLKRNCQEAFGVMPEYLTRSDASAYIERMSAR